MRFRLVAVALVGATTLGACSAAGRDPVAPAASSAEPTPSPTPSAQPPTGETPAPSSSPTADGANPEAEHSPAVPQPPGPTTSSRATPRPPAASPTPATPQDAYAADLVTHTNAARAARGLPPLTVSECARDVAVARATDLIGTGELVHADLGPVNAACSPPSGMTAENLSRGDVPALDVVDAWLASPGHANNLLSTELTQVGIGCVEDTGTDLLICAQVFLG